MQHHRREWYCAECVISFPTIPKFTSHLKEIHPALIAGEQDIPALFRSCERALDIPQQCPLCPFDSQHTPDQLRRHLSRHMQQLALFTLPTLEIGDNEGEGGGIQRVAGLKLEGQEGESMPEEQGKDGMSQSDFDSNPSEGPDYSPFALQMQIDEYQRISKLEQLHQDEEFLEQFSFPP